jgi:polar amino acid transport system substrate-binding protein
MQFRFPVIQRPYLAIAYIISITLSLSVNAAVTNERLVVEYLSNGKPYIAEGKKTAQGYRFNEQSTKVLNLATSNWPPYISEDICNNGWVFQFAVAVLVSKGYQVNIHFYPWARSVMLVEQGKMDILFPEYFIEDSAPSDTIAGKKRLELLTLSSAFAGSESSLLKRVNYSLDIKNGLPSLAGKIIGVVRGYQNTPELDALIDSSLFSTVEAVDELQLIRLLVAKRVDLIVADAKAVTHSVNYSHLPKNHKKYLLSRIEIVKPILKYNHLHFALSKKSHHWQQLLNDVNLALADFKQSGETGRFINTGSKCTTSLPLKQ